MKTIGRFLDAVRSLVRSGARRLAKFLDTITRGHITPNAVTVVSVLGHLPVAWCIAANHLPAAGILLIIFGLMDTLDGELARLQKRASPAGMLLDASTDRIKEVLIYSGIAYWCVTYGSPKMAAWATLAVGASLLVSYVKAKGEAAILSAKHIDHATVNRLFQDGLLRFEVRMGLLVIGLLFGGLLWIVAAIALLALGTAFERLIKISAKLNASA